MKNLLLLASAVSVVALASGANAFDSTGSAQITLTGAVGTAIAVADGSTTINVGNVTESGSGAARTVTLASFSNGAATNSTSGTTTFNVTANAVFKATVTSANHGLKNVTPGVPNPTVDYTISVNGETGVAASASGTGIATANTIQNAASGGTKSVPVTYSIAPSLPVSVGTYSDILTITFSPS